MSLDSQIVVSPRPLTTLDASGLKASIIPSLWSPDQILETDFNVGVPMTGLTLDGELWRISMIPPSAMPHYVFYPIAMRATLFNTDDDIGFPALFELPGLVSIQGIFEGGVDTPWNFYNFAFDAAFSAFDPTGPYAIQSMVSPFEGFPPKLPVAETGAPVNDALGALMLQVQTFNAVAAANTTLHIDARWLAFPRTALKSAGFYVPRQYFRPN